MTAKRGNELVIKRWDGATFVTVGALRTKSLTLNGNSIDVTTDDDVDGNNQIWRTRISGVKDFSVEGEGIAKLANKALVQAVYNDFALGTVTDYQVVVPYLGTFECGMIVSNMSNSASYDDVITFSLAIEAAEAPTHTPEA